MLRLLLACAAWWVSKLFARRPGRRSQRRTAGSADRFRPGLVSLEGREVPAAGLVLSEVLTNPTGNDSPLEYVELVATRDIDFAATPYTVVFADTTGSPGAAGWANGGVRSYAFAITTGAVARGSVVYVGGSGMAPTGTKLRTHNTATTPGDGFGSPQGQGVLGNGGSHADGVAVFDVPVGAITPFTVPIDALLFGSTVGTAAFANYTLPVNDRYTGGTANAGSYVAPDPGTGQIITASGVLDPVSGAWATGRTWTLGTTTTSGTSGVALLPVVTVAKVADATEGGTAGKFRLTRTGSTNLPLTVNVSASGTATAGSDYTASTTVTFAAGNATVDYTVTATNDTASEPTETVVFAVAAGSGYVVGSPATATVNILDNDARVVSVATINDAVEGGAAGTVRLTRTGSLSGALTVSYVTRAGFDDLAAPGADYVQLAGSVTFAPGAAAADIVVTTIDDNVPEPKEFVTVDLVGGSGYAVGAQATGTVRIDDSDGNGVTVGVWDTAPAAEGDAPGWFRLLRGGDLGQPLTVPYTLSGTASPSDYAVSGVPGEVTFGAGESDAFVYITRVPGRPGADGMTVTLTLTGGLEYAVTAASGTLLLIAAPPVGTDSVTVTGKDTRFELTKAVNLGLTKSTVDVMVDGKNVPIMISAYNSGRLEYKIRGEEIRSPNGAAISLVATTANETVMRDLNWLQFASRTGTLPEGQQLNQSFFSVRLSNNLGSDVTVYYADKEWIVDTLTKNSAYIGPGAIVMRGASGTGHALVFYDAPGYYKDSDFISQTFKARSYLVYQKQILYTVQWSITITRGQNGKWSDRVVSIDKSGPGKLDFPVDADANEWLWGYEDKARTKPVKVPNPLK